MDSNSLVYHIIVEVPSITTTSPAGRKLRKERSSDWYVGEKTPKVLLPWAGLKKSPMAGML